MNEANKNHPCEGKDCRYCETCIFDVDLFVDKVHPNTKKEEIKTNNMCNSSRLCNNCINLIRNHEDCIGNKFDAACKVVSYEAFGETRPRRMAYNVSPMEDIPSPTWCPLRESAAQLMLPTPSQVTHKPSPQTTGPTASEESLTHMSYSERREKMKQIKRHLEWEDIEEGKLYVIPKILSQATKIVKVITKTDMCCTCHEISQVTGNEYQYNCSIYPSDIDAVFITELRKF